MSRRVLNAAEAGDKPGKMQSQGNFAEVEFMNKWFKSVFLPSLFERAGTNRPMWLTAKQTAVCTDNMTRETVIMTGKYGGRQNHIRYSCQWNGRDVMLEYSKINGCGAIRFGLTEGEQEKAIEEAKAYNAARDAERKAWHVEEFRRCCACYRSLRDGERDVYHGKTLAEARVEIFTELLEWERSLYLYDEYFHEAYYPEDSEEYLDHGIDYIKATEKVAEYQEYWRNLS